MNKGHLYRLQQLHEIEKEIHFEKIKQESVVTNYHHVINFFHVCFILVQFCMFLLNVDFLANFQEIIGNISGKILQGLNLIFGSVSNFLKGIEKFLFNKIQRHEKQKTLIEMQHNTVYNMVSKALTNNEISEAEFENILFQTRKRNETYIKFEEVDLEAVICGHLCLFVLKEMKKGKEPQEIFNKFGDIINDCRHIRTKSKNGTKCYKCEWSFT